MKTEVEVEYMEIYNETIRDLFSGSKEHKEAMKVREHPKKGVYVEGVIRKACGVAAGEGVNGSGVGGLRRVLRRRL